MVQIDWAAVTAAVLGVLVGAVAVLSFRISEREQRRMPEREPPAVDEGAAAVLAVLRSAAVVLDRAGTVLWAGAAAHAFGLVRDGRIVHERVRTTAEKVGRQGETVDVELTLPRGPVGMGTIALELRIAPLGIDRVLVLAEDRTESARLEEIRRDFVANVSHELKTPVGAIALLAETVGDAADDPDAVRRFAGRMEAEARRLGILVTEIIELSRLQVQDAFADLSPVPLDDVVAEAVDRVATEAGARGISVEVGGSRGLEVFGDHDLLVTAVRNLVDNAVNYSPEGTHVGVGLRQAGDLVEIAVVDQGIGIPPGELDRIFERFYRVDPARSRATGGTGLGLSIVKHVASNHGGEVTVRSRPAHGSTFTLRLPRHGAGPTTVEDLTRPGMAQV